MPGKRKWDSSHELFLLAGRPGSGMVSSIGTHFTIRFPVSTPWMGVGVAFVMWLVSQWGVSQTWVLGIFSVQFDEFQQMYIWSRNYHPKQYIEHFVTPEGIPISSHCPFSHPQS